jgi:hypothetical protein
VDATFAPGAVVSVKAYKFLLVRAHATLADEPLLRMLAAVLIGNFCR